MMKKVLVFCLALVLCLSALTGCGKGGVNYEGEVKEGFLYETTGISPDAVMFTVNGVDVTAEEFFYWIGYGCGELSYYGSIDWAQDVNGMTMDEYIKGEAVKTASLYAVIKGLAEDYKVELSEEDIAASAADIAGYAEYYGGMAAYEEQMAKQGASLAMMEEINRIVYLYNNLMALYEDESSKLYPSEAEISEFAAASGAYTVKHVLFDIRTCTEEEAAAKLRQAEEILAALDNRGDADLVTLFESYVSEYGEDPGMTTSPKGYTFYDADDESLVPGFADTSKALGEYEYSDILVTDYGYHIILRLPLDTEAVVTAHFEEFIQESLATAEVVYSDSYAGVSAQAHYENLLDQMAVG